MRFVSSGVGIVLGGLFVYAGVQKHLAPYEFAEAILAYQLLPSGLVGLVAATLPWVEMVSGFSLILGCLLGSRRFSNPFPVGGILRRSGLLLILGQSLLFVAVLLITMARGLKIDCGCGLFFQRQVGLESILEDALLLGWRVGFIGGNGRPGTGRRDRWPRSVQIITSTSHYGAGEPRLLYPRWDFKPRFFCSFRRLTNFLRRRKASPPSPSSTALCIC